jgi:hypothetical protein
LHIWQNRERHQSYFCSAFHRTDPFSLVDSLCCSRDKLAFLLSSNKHLSIDCHMRHNETFRSSDTRAFHRKASMDGRNHSLRR